MILHILRDITDSADELRKCSILGVCRKLVMHFVIGASAVIAFVFLMDWESYRNPLIGALLATATILIIAVVRSILKQREKY